MGMFRPLNVQEYAKTSSSTNKASCLMAEVSLSGALAACAFAIKELSLRGVLQAAQENLHSAAL